MADNAQKTTSSIKQDLNNQISDILSRDDLAEKLAQLENERVEIQNDIEKDEDQIRTKLEELKVIKSWIETELKKVNEKKSALKEIESNEEQIKQLEESKKKINAGIKSLDAKLANLNHSTNS